MDEAVPATIRRTTIPPMRKIYASDNGVIIGHIRQVLENHAILMNSSTQWKLWDHSMIC